MATYAEIRDLFNNSDLKNRIEVAVIVYAQSLMSQTPSAAQKAWIAKVLQAPTAEAAKVMLGVLAANKGLSQAQILAAGDPAIQAQVDLIAPILIDALAGV